MLSGFSPYIFEGSNKNSQNNYNKLQVWKFGSSDNAIYIIINEIKWKDWNELEYLPNDNFLHEKKINRRICHKIIPTVHLFNEKESKLEVVDQ